MARGTRPRRPRFVPPDPPVTRKAAETRARLLDDAGRLFLERGYDAVSMRDIAAAADLTKGAVYGHFRSKGQLLVEVIRWKLAKREHEPGFLDALSNPEASYELFFATSGRDIRLLEVDAAAAARHDADVAAGMHELYAERHAAIRAAVSGLAEDPEAVAWVVGVLSAGIGMKEVTGPDAPSTPRAREVLQAMLGATGDL